jgi:cell division protein FtsB
MTDMDVQPVAEPNAQAPGLSQMQRVTYTFTAPSKTFEDIKRGNKSWWMPLLIMAIVGYLFFAVVVSKVTMQTVVDNQMKLASESQQEQLAKAPPEQREMQAKISLYVTEGIFIASPLFVLAVAAIVSLVLWGTINFAFGGKAKFGAIFAVWFFANLPSIFKTLLGIVVVFISNTPETFNIKNFAPTNLAAFIYPNPAEANKALYALTSSLDAVSIWCLVLMGIGLATVAGVKRSSGYIAVFGWWAIVVLVGVGFAAIQG